MKRRWIPAALMGCLAVGYLAGSACERSRDEGPPAGSATSGTLGNTLPPAPPVDPVARQPPPAAIPGPKPDDGPGEYPPWNGVDLDCDDLDGPVRVTGEDPHRLDRDRNGIGCEGR